MKTIDIAGAFGRLFGAGGDERAEARLSRRGFLLVLGTAGGAALAGPALLKLAPAAAEDQSAGAAPQADEAVRLAQRYDDRYDRRDDRSDRYDRRDDRHDWRDERRGRRRDERHFSRRDLYRRCDRDRGFRHDHRELCRRILGGYRPRNGACIDLGGFRICGD